VAGRNSLYNLTIARICDKKQHTNGNVDIKKPLYSDIWFSFGVKLEEFCRQKKFWDHQYSRMVSNLALARTEARFRK
jgi:hypothetical protein